MGRPGKRPTFAELLAQRPELAQRIQRCTPDPRGALERETVKPLARRDWASSSAQDGHARRGSSGSGA